MSGQDNRRLKVLLLEPFYGGSHKSFVDGLAAASRHRIEPVTLPARFWKWRMRGASLYFLNNISNLKKYDCMMASSLMSLADFVAVAGCADLPTAVYFHENQLAYPLAPGEHRDHQFGFTDITSALTADRILFNSHYHRSTFFDHLPGFVRRMPDFQPMWLVENLRRKAAVVYPGCRFDGRPPALRPHGSHKPAVVWNHRWEHDKNPDLFFEAVDEMVRRGLDFDLILMGEGYRRTPPSFQAARDRYHGRILQYGFVAPQQEYQRWLMRGTVVVSTAHQENFGMAVVEAVRHGCLPLLPARLAYPEILPARFHGDCLYGEKAELIRKLTFMLTHYRQLERQRAELSRSMGRFAWRHRIDEFDEMLVSLTARGPDHAKRSKT